MTLAKQEAETEQQSKRAGMRLIVPLQGVVHGRSGLLLGTLVPCALFYFLQLYLKRHRSGNPPPSSSSSNPPSPSTSSPHLGDLTRSSSRSNLHSRGSSGQVRVSTRAAPIAKPSESPYYIGMDRVLANPYDRTHNPDGIIELGLSYNRLCVDLIENYIKENTSTSFGLGRDGDDLSINGITMYGPFDGLMPLKLAMAGFMSRVMGGFSFDPSNMVLTSGTTPAIELLSFCLADHGNAFLVPTPYYPGFDRDMRWRTGVELIPVHCRSTDNFVLSITALDQAYNQARKRGMKVRGVLISNPTNPVGNILPRQLLFDLLDFAREKNIHIISDEVYAGTVYGTEEFVSMAEILETQEFERDRVHIVYGLSKDLGLAGFRVGLIYSRNQNVLSAAKKLARFAAISQPTQALVTSMLLDTRFIDGYLQTSKKRLQKMCNLFVQGLKELGIMCVGSSAGFYCWANMSDLISSYSEKGELELWEKFLNVSKISVTPGSTCHCIEPGWFRCCFTVISEEDIPLVMKRIKEVLDNCKSPR